MNRTLPLRYDPRLIEEAVFFAQRSRGETTNDGAERERLYEIADPDERERLFAELNRARFIRLGLDGPIEQALREQPVILLNVQGCYVACAGQAKEEGAELFVASDDTPLPQKRRTVRILLRPVSLLDKETVLMFLRHELFHIADMLDPIFAYEPVLPPSDAGPAYDSLLRDRYQTLWNTVINGRMVKRGWLPDSTRTQSLRDFAASFPLSDGEAEKVFSRLFDHGPHTHPELVAFSQNPRALFGDLIAGPQPGSRCALCGFPTYSFEPQPESLDRFTLAGIAYDFPQWHPSHGLCAQCADLYRAKRLSMEAASQLPGWRNSTSG